MSNTTARLTLHLLGGCDIRLCGVPVHLETAKTRALLAYLALEPSLHERHKLAGLLWGDLPEFKAQRALRHALWDLRRTLCDPSETPVLHITPQTAGMNPSASFWVDAGVFVQLTESGQLDFESGESRLIEAAALYRGELLDGFYIRDALAFEEWLLVMRENLRVRRVTMLLHLVAWYASRGEYETSLVYARQLISADPWREEAQREVINLLALSGQRSAALAQYATCRRILAKELGIEPTAETQQLYQRILSGA